SRGVDAVAPWVLLCTAGTAGPGTAIVLPARMPGADHSLCSRAAGNGAFTCKRRPIASRTTFFGCKSHPRGKTTLFVRENPDLDRRERLFCLEIAFWTVENGSFTCKRRP